MNTTKQVIQELTGKRVKRVTEMAYVVVAVFTEGRSRFISKRAIIQRSQSMNADDVVALAVLGEWEINPSQKVADKTQSLEVLCRRVSRAGFTCVSIKGSKVEGCIPRNEFDRTVARQIAKENGWQIKNGVVIAA